MGETLADTEADQNELLLAQTQVRDLKDLVEALRLGARALRLRARGRRSRLPPRRPLPPPPAFPPWRR